MEGTLIFFLFCGMQLPVDFQIPDEFGGLNGEAIFIGIAIFIVLLSEKKNTAIKRSTPLAGLFHDHLKD